MRKRLRKKLLTKFRLPKRRRTSLAAPEVNDEVQQINPSTMLFHFQLSADECHKTLTGTCSLDKPFATGERQDGEAGVHYCQNLLLSFEQYGFRQPVDVSRFRCGHYGFSDGQHRVCIAKKKGLELPALVSNEDGQDCESCAPQWKLDYAELR